MNDIDGQINSLIIILQSLHDEHLLVQRLYQHQINSDTGNDANIIRMDLPRIQNSSDKVLLAIDNAELLKLLSEYLKIVDANRINQSNNIKKLTDESNWLRDEVSYLQQNLRKSNEKIVELEEENKHLNFLLELKTVDKVEFEKDKDVGNNIFMGIDNLESREDADDGEEHKDDANGDNAGNQANASGFELPPRLKTLHNLVIQYASQGRYEVAIPLCKQALEDLEKTSGRNHPDVATMLNILALVYRDQNKFGDAVNLLKEALSIREATLGPVHVSVAANLNNLAVLYGKQKMFSEAEPLCKRSLLIREQLLGPDHPDVAKQLNNLALLCQNVGKYVEVEQYYQKAVKIYTDAYGPFCVDVSKTKNNLASAFMKQGKFRDAEMMYKEIINVAHEAMCGSIAPNNKPIWMLAEEKQYGHEGSINTQDDEKDSWTQILRNDWSMHHTALKNLASLYRRLNKIEAADVVDDLAKSNLPKQTERAAGLQHYQQERPAVFKNPVGIKNMPLTISINQETPNIGSTTQTKIKANNSRKSSGPIKASRVSLADKFTANFSKKSTAAGGIQLGSVDNFWQSSGDGRLKKASSLSVLSGVPIDKRDRNLDIKTKDSGQTWLSKGRTSSIENLKKAFGKRS